MIESLCWLGVNDLIAGYASGNLSPREVFSALAARIQQSDPEIGAFTALSLDEAEREADACTEELAHGVRRGPLHGIPVAIKELFDVAGAVVSYGSLVFRERVAESDAEVVRRLRGAGAIIMGVTRSHEFGWGITTQHAQRGGTRNPWDYNRVPGGSSGGSAAAVAAGMVPIALGSDTGGSIRIPAGFCGIAGLKPTYGRVSKRGAVPLAPSLDHPGFFARDVQDLAVAFCAVAGYDAEDPTTSRDIVPSINGSSSGLADLRVGLAPSLHYPRLQADHEAVFRSVIETISRGGAELRELQTPASGEIRSTFTTIQMAEAYHVHARLLGTFPARSDEYGTDVRSRLHAAADVSLEQYLSAREMAARIRRQFEIAFKKVDVLITPVSGGGPSTIDDPDYVDHSGSRISFRDLVLNYTVPQDLIGFPVCAVRAGFDKDGLPVGIQVTAPLGREDLALRVARSLQMMLGEREYPGASVPLAVRQISQQH